LVQGIGQPLILYNYPGRYRHRIDVPTVAALASQGLVSSIKDTAGDFEYMKELLQLKRSYPNLGVFESALQNLAKAAPLGIDGSVQALANLFPEDFSAVWAAIVRRDWPTVTRGAERLSNFHLAMENVAIFIAAVKGCMAIRKWCDLTPGAPTRPVSPQQLHELEQLLGRFDSSGGKPLAM
jgi:4-hydroxy-tetrahydrodipicolinate synthase